MRKIHQTLVLLAALSAPSIFAADYSNNWSNADNPCAMIAKACKAAGYSRKENEGKKFWFNCMKPILMGKTVAKVDIKPEAAKACRNKKIEELKKELADFQNNQ